MRLPEKGDGEQRQNALESVNRCKRIRLKNSYNLEILISCISLLIQAYPI